MSLRLFRDRINTRFNAIPLPRDLDEITRIDRDNEVLPAEAGLSQAAVNSIWADTLVHNLSAAIGAHLAAPLDPTYVTAWARS